MCGRYTLSNPGDILEELGVVNPDLGETLAPRYNIAPTQTAPVVRAAEGGERKLAVLRWGLIPFWAKEEAIGNRMINARGETVAEKTSFKRPLKSQRCLVLADGFYEWRKMNGGKQPFHIYLGDHRPITFAGLWDRWSKGPQPIESFTIITTDANPKVSELHDRMPVILDAEARDVWLDPSVEDPEELSALLRPYGGGDLDFSPVAKIVNSPKNDRPECIEPISL